MANGAATGRNVTTGLLRAGVQFCNARPVLSLVVLNVLATLLVYVPLYQSQDDLIRLSFSGLSMDNIYRYWDGPLYLVVAKTFYNVGSPELTAFADLAPGYYAAHFPGYPATIRVLSYVFGYTNGMIAATVAATSLAIWVLYLLLKDLGLSSKALWLGAVFSVFAAAVADLPQCGSGRTTFHPGDACVHSLLPAEAVLAGWTGWSAGGTNPQSGYPASGSLRSANRLGILPGVAPSFTMVGGPATTATHGSPSEWLRCSCSVTSICNTVTSSPISIRETIST